MFIFTFRTEATACDNATDDESLASGDRDDAIRNTIKGNGHKTKKKLLSKQSRL